MRKGHSLDTFEGCIDRIGLLVGFGLRGVRTYSKIFDLSSWKNRVVLTETGKTEKSGYEGGDQELSFGHVKFVMPIRHPDVGVQ